MCVGFSLFFFFEQWLEVSVLVFATEAALAFFGPSWVSCVLVDPTRFLFDSLKILRLLWVGN